MMLASFQMLISHLYVFLDEMSIQIPCQILNWVPSLTFDNLISTLAAIKTALSDETTTLNSKPSG